MNIICLTLMLENMQNRMHELRRKDLSLLPLLQNNSKLYKGIDLNMNMKFECDMGHISKEIKMLCLTNTSHSYS